MLLLPGGCVYVLPSRLNRASPGGQELGLAGGVGGCGAAGLEETGRVAQRSQAGRTKRQGCARLPWDTKAAGCRPFWTAMAWSLSFLIGNHRKDCTSTGVSVVSGLKFPLGTAG